MAQTPQYDVSSVGDLEQYPYHREGTHAPEILGDVVSTSRRAEMAVVSHYNIQRAIDIFGNVQDRDLGGVATDINRIVEKAREKLPRGSQMIVRGQIDTMQIFVSRPARRADSFHHPGLLPYRD